MRRLIGLFLLIAGAVSAQPAGDEPVAKKPEIAKEGEVPVAKEGEVPVAKEGEVPVAKEKAISKPSRSGEGVRTGDEAYRVKVSELEGRVNDLKEKIFRSKTRLAILKESVLSSSIAGAEARIVHRNEMGSSFKLEKVAYSLDGSQVLNLVDKEGSLDGKKEVEVLNGPIVPGNHTISVVMVYRGNGYGIFSYLRGYVFNLRSSHTFRVEEGKRVEVKIVGYEKGGITTDLKDRPDIRFEDTLSETGRKDIPEKSDG